MRERSRDPPPEGGPRWVVALCTEGLIFAKEPTVDRRVAVMPVSRRPMSENVGTLAARVPWPH